MNEKSSKRGFQIVIFMTSRRLKGSFHEKIVVVVIHRAARGVDRKGFVMGADFGLIFPDFSCTIQTLKDTV